MVIVIKINTRLYYTHWQLVVCRMVFYHETPMQKFVCVFSGKAMSRQRLKSIECQISCRRSNFPKSILFFLKKKKNLIQLSGWDPLCFRFQKPFGVDSCMHTLQCVSTAKRTETTLNHEMAKIDRSQ